MTAGQAAIATLVIVGVVAVLAGFAVGLSLLAKHAQYLWERRHVRRRIQQVTVEPTPASIHPISLARARHDSNDDRPAA